MLEGVTISESAAQKDELILQGNDIQNVSQSGMFVSLYSTLLTDCIYFLSCFHPGHLSCTEQGYP
jgi:hypothetical protein